MTATVPGVDPARTTLELARKRLDTDGFATISDGELGLRTEVRHHIHRTYFNEHHLHVYDFDIPADRERARDVVRYERLGGDDVRLTEHDTIAIANRDGRAYRDFRRVELLGDASFRAWITAALSLVPVPHRRRRGTFGINLFRTHTDVVSRPHQDGEEYILIYLLERVGTGAQTYLYDKESGDVVHHSTLQPGDLIVFRDDAFLHTATPLRPPAGRPAHRDALVCTVNYHDTYMIAG
jgi:hypothetical protein